MPVSPAKLAANRANAKKSTGPRTVRGKECSSRNAVTHGIFCNDLVLKGESQEMFDQLRNNLLMELSPQTLVELMICDRIVTAQWKLRRLNTVELMTHDTNAQRTVIDSIHDSEKLQMQSKDDDEVDAEEAQDRLTRISRILRTPWPKSVDDMCDLLDEHKEYVSPTAAISMSFLKDDGLMERLSRYEQRLELSIHRNLKQLEKVKKQTETNRESRKMHCPFIDQKFYDDLHEQIEEHKRELDGENEPTEEVEDEEVEAESTTKSTKNTKKSERRKTGALSSEKLQHPEAMSSSALTQPLPAYRERSRSCEDNSAGASGLIRDGS